MKLKIMTSDAIAYVKKNIDTLTDYYKNGDDPEVWIKEKTGKNPFREIEYKDFEDVELLISDASKPANDDVTNIKYLYLSLKDVDDSFAADERLWAGLSHTIFYEYMCKRWNKYDSKSILNHFFFSGGKPRCYMVNTLARLWWLGRKTYINNSDEPWKVLDYISHDINGYSFTLFGSNWSNSERSLDLFFKSIDKYEDEKAPNKVGRELFNDAMQHMNALCGIYMIDACDDEFITSQVYDYLVDRNDQIVRTAEENKLKGIKTTGIERLDNIVKAINLIGGYGTQGQIFSGYQDIISKPISIADKIYIENNLAKYCATKRSFGGSSIFHEIVIDNRHMWKLGVDYLTNDNKSKMKQFADERINALNDNEKVAFNLVSSLKDKFTMEDILSFKQQLNQIYPDIQNIDEFIESNINSLRLNGIIEKIDKSTFRKAYNFKIN